MVIRLAKLLVRPAIAWLVVIAALVATAISVGVGLQVEQDDDVLQFLPRSNPDIATFYEINESFGGLDMAMVGVSTPDVFDGAFLQQLDAATDAVGEVQGVDYVLSLTSVPDFVNDEINGGIIQDKLVSAIPSSAAESAALRAKVFNRDQVVGNLISDEADAVVIYAFPAYGTDQKVFADKVRTAVSAHFEADQLFWGGAPFVSQHIFDATQKDMAKLTPWSIAVIVLIMLVAFRDVVGAGMGLLATGMGIAMSRALMVASGESFNILLSSSPIILFAIGSAYSIHILAHFYTHAENHDRKDAVVRTLVGTGPTVLAAGLTTVAGLFSFMMMDIEPMRTFGLFTGLGILITLILSLTFVPAAISLFGRRIHLPSTGPLQPAMMWFAEKGIRQPVRVGIGLAITAILCVSMAGRVDSRMDLTTFYQVDSEPDLAMKFLEDEFGGSQFIQILVETDLTRPEALREMGRVAAALRDVPQVSAVIEVSQIVGIGHDAFAGSRRLPDSPKLAGFLYGFLSSDPSVGALVNDERNRALMQVRIDGTDADLLESVLAEVRAVMAAEATPSYSILERSADPEAVQARLDGVLAVRLADMLDQAGIPTSSSDVAEKMTSLPSEAPASATAAGIEKFLRSDESWVALTPNQAHAVAEALAVPGDAREQMATALDVPQDDALIEDLLIVLDGPLPEIRRDALGKVQGDALAAALSVEPTELMAKKFHGWMAERAAPTALGPGSDMVIDWTVNGMPVMYEGLSRSVQSNQIKSLALALGMVFIIMSGLFRSFSAGFVATCPTLATLALVYGIMGAAGVHLDVGTSMLASLIIGAGVDYAVHLMAEWRTTTPGDWIGAARHAISETSRAIWTNAVMVGAGFFVLTLGDARPLQNVGLLTATAMLAAALSTFVVIPLMAKRPRYVRDHLQDL